MSNYQRHQHSPVPPSNQQGAVLIVVLLFLILIILGGVIAVKQSTTDLKLATSDQINALLLQSADNANQNIEQSINGSSDADAYDAMISRGGPFGHFILTDFSIENEYVFCFRPRDQLFNINKTSIITPDGSLTSSGYCSPSKSDDYVSSRNTSMTQVNVALTPPNAENEAFGSYTIGQGSDLISSKAFMFDINSTAVLPAYGDTEVGGQDCFEQTSRLHTATTADYTDTIGGCMAKAGAPSKVVYEMADVQNQSLRTKCVDFGKGAGLLCTLPAS
ncbi:PilX N-terminal domain-containing pilus assembly protein [Psychrobacter jeotgali]|uniref:PilX N-terminal domain-containing pilus assembly protein n=1 Tax=Psychrobacter jeotgali TaxID=179010 RepID=UPI00191966C0|nr:PilX N-terminal domain-containing pilus assembly protein [Psychrobacter jeotgali]